MQITGNGTFDLNRGYEIIVSEYDGENCRIQFQYGGGTILEYFDEDDHLIPLSELGEVITLPEPEGWAKDNPYFIQDCAVICLQEGEGCTWIQRVPTPDKWAVLAED